MHSAMPCAETKKRLNSMQLSCCCLQILAQAAHDAGKEAGFKFSATEELQDLFLVHADTVASFHETRA